jgi:hypothetical protein
MTAGASKVAMMIKQPALAPSPQSQPAPPARALPQKLAAQRGPFCTPIRGPFPMPIDTRRTGFGLVTPAHRPASAWQRSPQACNASSASWSSFMPYDILQVGPLQRGWINTTIVFRKESSLPKPYRRECYFLVSTNRVAECVGLTHMLVLLPSNILPSGCNAGSY